MKSDLFQLEQAISAKTFKKVQAYYDKYYQYEFVSSTGETAEYNEFIKDTKAALKALLGDIGFELVSFSKIHFEYSCRAKNTLTGKTARIACADIRSPNEMGSGFDFLLVEDVDDKSYRQISSFGFLVQDLRSVTRQL